VITIGGRNDLALEVVNSMHQFRHEVFVHRLNWSLPLIDGTERDEFDNADAVYFIVSDDNERVTACARLLPTTGPYLLSERFAELLGEQPAPQDPQVWELSRFAASVRKTGAGRVLSLSPPTLDLLDAVIKFAQQRGVSRLALVTTVAIERLLLRAGLDVHRLAAPQQVRDCLCVALVIELPAAAAPETPHQSWTKQ